MINLLAAFKITTLSCRADEWMSGAVDCLEFLPDELVVEVSRGLSGCADDLPECKRLLHEVLAQHYGHAQQPPLLSNHVFDIHSGISELLGKRRSCRGLFGVRLFSGGLVGLLWHCANADFICVLTLVFSLVCCQ